MSYDALEQCGEAEKVFVMVHFLIDHLLFFLFYFFFFKQKTAYEIGTGDWSSDVCSSDLNSVVHCRYSYHPRREKSSIV